ncbi:unnamed protein product [Didymodactylos carnosus]|uniref:Dynein regulatory complex protein 12 n=1 Tax=Didymodactylos carnosus TaxID=1234261 RepID=A0A813UY79_9BILA|nr:unnamed protein product [Didymodactylos carnosus]CAF3621143.1 unnamed protein product [Didymodactylos carnosus]
MPPKKKGKGKKGKGKGGDGDENEDRLKQSQHEIDALKDQMAYRREISRRSRSIADNYRDQIHEAEKNVQELTADMKSISSGLTHQYKTLQMELGLKITTLELELGAVRKQLSITDQELTKNKGEKEQLVKSKELHIHDLETKIANMELSFESMLDGAFNSIIQQLNEEKKIWDSEVDDVFRDNKQALKNLNLLHLEV